MSSNLTSRIRFRTRARVAQTAEAALSKGVSVRVRIPPRASRTRARVAQAGRGGVLKTRRLRVRVSPRALAKGRSIKAMRQAPTLRSLRWDTCPFDSGRPCQTFKNTGVYAKGKAGCPSNSRPGGFAGSNPATPVRSFHVGRSSTGRALHWECSPLRVRIPPADLSSRGALAKPV